MSDPRVEAAAKAMDEFWNGRATEEPDPEWEEWAIAILAAVDAVSSQYEQVGRCEFAWNDTFRRLPDVHPSQMSVERDERGWTKLYARIVPTSDGDGLDAVREATRDELRENDHARLLAHQDADRTTTGATLPGTRALIDNRTPAETAEVKAWSDDAHARMRAGEVSGSHDLMRAKVGMFRADTQEPQERRVCEYGCERVCPVLDGEIRCKHDRVMYRPIERADTQPGQSASDAADIIRDTGA